MKFSFFKRQSPDKKFQSTLESYQSAVEENPGDLRLRVKIAELYLEHDRRDEAIVEYLAVAKMYQDKRLFQIAVAIYKHVISIDPDQVDVYSELAELHLKNGFVGDSVAVLEQLANHYYEEDMKYEATQVLKKIGEIDPENKFFEIKVAKFYENKDLSVEESLKQGPQDKWELVEEEKKAPAAPIKSPADNFFDLQAALDDDVAINISTEDEGAGAADASALAPDKVFKEIQQIMETEPDHNSPKFHYNLALAYQRTDQLSEALAQFYKALEGSEKKVDCCVKIAECSIALSSYDDALKALAKAVKDKSLTEQDRLELLYQTGLVHKAKGDKANALKVFKKIQGINADFKAVGTQIKHVS